MTGELPERTLDLPGLTQGAATEHLVTLAQQLGYAVVSAGPGAFRLARTRRTMLVRKQVESVVATVLGDRNGTRARFVGPVDIRLVDGLGALASPEVRPAAGAAFAPSTPPPAPSPPPAPVPPMPVAGSPGGPPPMQRGGLIDSPWCTPVVPATSPHAPATAPVHADDALEGYTIARSALRGHRTASLVLPDGRTLDLTRAVVLGRNPDANRGPAGAVAVAHGDPSLSKTHAVVEADGDLVYVTDLHSTNGTVIESAGGRSSCAPAVRIAIPEHAVVRLGDVAIRVTPAP